MPGFVVAVLLHSGFNHLSHLPLLETLATMLTLPPLLWLVFERSERSLRPGSARASMPTRASSS